VLPTGEFFLHTSVLRADPDGCHISHPSLVGIPKLDQVLEINVAVSWYLNTPGAHHLDLVIRYINATKMYAAVDKEIHEFWTVLDTTATTKMKQMEQMLNIAATFCYPI